MPDSPCLSGELFWKWRAHDAEVRLAVAELDSVARQIGAELAKHAELAALLSRQTALRGAASAAKLELLNVHGEIETQLGVKLADCSIDDRTGQVHHHAATKSAT